MNWLKKKIDNWYFIRSILKNKIGLGTIDLEWLKDHSSHIQRIAETMKGYIINTTFHSLTTREHQRRKDWFDCLTTMQNLSKITTKKQQMDYLRMKPIVPKEKK